MAKSKKRQTVQGAKQTRKDTSVEVEPVKVGRVRFWLRGQTPLIMNSMSAKAKGDLLFPKGKKTAGDKKTTLKHDPMREFRDSMYKRLGTGPTRLIFPSPGVKKSMMTAALDTKGATKTSIGRLVWVTEYSCDVYGIPELFMSVVRCADRNKTPDIRTRAIIPKWCMPVTIAFAFPQISETAIFQLLANAGFIVGVGDFRQEKGAGNFGQYEIVQETDCKALIEAGGIKAQDKAIKAPKCYDVETEELYAWFMAEVGGRGKIDMLAS